jgi:hypothetical protein
MSPQYCLVAFFSSACRAAGYVSTAQTAFACHCQIWYMRSGRSNPLRGPSTAAARSIVHAAHSLRIITRDIQTESIQKPHSGYTTGPRESTWCFHQMEASRTFSYNSRTSFNVATCRTGFNGHPSVSNSILSKRISRTHAISNSVDNQFIICKVFGRLIPSIELL